jgi:hypothetical protein
MTTWCNLIHTSCEIIQDIARQWTLQCVLLFGVLPSASCMCSLHSFHCYATPARLICVSDVRLFDVEISEYPSESNCSRDHNHYCLVLLSLSILPMLCGMPPKHRDIQTVQGFNYALYCIVTKARIKYPFKPLYVEYHLYVRFYN